MPKLTRLIITNFRGIKQLDLALAGSNVAILGPNGSGKSSVVDAVDFLLTGRVRRLSGEGAGDLSLVKHGPHLDAEPKDAVVMGHFTLPDRPQPVSVSRSLAAPEELTSDGPIPQGIIQLCAGAKSSSHHLLTRKEILRYIVAEPSSRGQQVASLLNLASLDSFRKTLQGAARDAADRTSEALGAVRSCTANVLRSFKEPAGDIEQLLGLANDRRLLLGGSPLSSLSLPSAIRGGLTEPTKAAAHPLQSQRVKELLSQAAEQASAGLKVLADQVEKYAAAVTSLKVDLARVQSMKSAELLRSGLSALNGPHCPLCLHEWPAGELEKLLTARLADAEDAAKELRGLRATRQEILVSAATMASTITSLIAALAAETSVDIAPLVALGASLQHEVSTCLPDPLDDAPPIAGQTGALRAHLTAPAITECLDALQGVQQALPPLDGSQAAWDELAALARALTESHAATERAKLSTAVSAELAAFEQAFVKARDETLANTYEAIAGKFASFYRSLNGPDEDGFAASLLPTKAGLRLEVAFYDKGSFPPGAVHSEGHQDGMGLCLFLSLARHLSGGAPSLIVLDDVVMSVDQGHRRFIAELLRDEFSGTQFVITTHDRVWFRQLKSVGLVKSKGCFAFEGWSLTDGPTCTTDAGGHLRMAVEALARSNVPQAAHALRRTVEEYFPEFCDALHASVRYRADGAFEAGDFVASAMSRYSELLDRVIKAAASWQQDMSKAVQLREQKNKTFATYQAETWAVNPSIHYNEWAQLSVADFKPVLEAYQELFSLFLCGSGCGSTIRLLTEGREPVALKCECGSVSWNLRAKQAKN